MATPLAARAARALPVSPSYRVAVEAQLVRVRLHPRPVGERGVYQSIFENLLDLLGFLVQARRVLARQPSATAWTWHMWGKGIGESTPSEMTGASLAGATLEPREGRDVRCCYGGCC